MNETLATVAGMIREVVEDDVELDAPISSETSFAEDLELESIEFVALAEKLQACYGERVDLVGWFSGKQLDEIIGLRVGDLVEYIDAVSIVRANGLSFHVQELGQGSPVVMLHGFLLGNLASWYFTVAPALRDRHRLMLYDLRGHGRTERVPTGYDLRTMADDLGALARPFAGGAPLDLVGHSLGALIALRYALDHPHEVRRLVLVEMPLPPSDSAEVDFYRRLYGQTDPEAMAQVVEGHVMGGRRGALRLVRQVGFLIDESTAVADLRAEPDIPDAVLSRVGQPVLCVYGTQSRCLPAGRRLASALPHATLELVDGGHYLPVERPRELSSVIAGFLS